MNVDRLPDNTDDPRPDAEPARSTHTFTPENPAPPAPKPDHHPPPERAPGQERKPDQEQRPDKGHDPAREHPPVSSPAETDSPANDTPDPAEPRSRQEHAAPAADEVGDRDTSVRAEADAVPEGEVAPDDVGAGGKAEQDLGSPRESRPDDLPEREDETTDQTEVSDALEKTETGSPDTDAALPVHDRTLPLTDKEWSEHVTEVRDALDKARAAGLESRSLVHDRPRCTKLGRKIDTGFTTPS